MSVAQADPQAPRGVRYNMMLEQDEFLSDVSGHSGRYPKGAVLTVDEPTAIRWYERGIATIAPPDAKTYGEITRANKREEFLKQAKATEGVFNKAITRDGSTSPAHATDGPREMPRRGRKGGQGHPNLRLEGAPVINTADLDENEV